MRFPTQQINVLNEDVVLAQIWCSLFSVIFVRCNTILSRKKYNASWQIKV